MSFGEHTPSFMRKENYKKIKAVADWVLRESLSAFGENYLSIYMAWLDSLFIHSFIFQNMESFLYATHCAM